MWKVTNNWMQQEIYTIEQIEQVWMVFAKSMLQCLVTRIWLTDIIKFNRKCIDARLSNLPLLHVYEWYI